MAGGCSAVALIASGMAVEPLVHPKPGAVTRLVGHPDKDVFDFALHGSFSAKCLYEACEASSRRGCTAGVKAGLSCYMSVAEVLGLKGRNVGFGSFMMALPLASALGRGAQRIPEVLAVEASRCALSCGGDVGELYLRVLATLSPSHLKGRYEGRAPDVWEPRRASLREILEAASWDLVHAEILEGYPRSLAASRIILTLMRWEGLDLEESLRWALLWLLSSYGDTLIFSRHGGKAYLKALLEARAAWRLAARIGASRALEWLDAEWRPRGWNPGATLDILATAASLALIASEAGARGATV